MKKSFWNKLRLYIGDNSFNRLDEANVTRVIYLYLIGKQGFEWDRLSLNMQEILIGFETELLKEKIDIKGLIPEGAQLNHCCQF